MKLTMVYREKSDCRLMVENFLRDFRFQTGNDISTLDPDTRDGADFCRLHDIVRYPTLIATMPDGSVYRMWTGDLPAISEAALAANA